MKLAQTDVVILCGGLGTRLGLTDVPKPMVDINGKPFLDILVEWAAAQGAKRFIFCTGHKAEAVRSYFAKHPGREYLFSEEDAPLGTGGALKLCEPLKNSATALVLNGDSFCDMRLQEFLDFHGRDDAGASVALARAGERTDGGFVSLDNESRITNFAEKDPKGGTWINAGVLALGPKIFSALPNSGPCSLEREIFPKFLNGGLRGFTTQAPLYDIGTPERLEAFRRARRT